MRVLLVQTETLFDEPPIFPLGLAYLSAAILEKGHKVYVHDSNLGLRDNRSLERAVETTKPDIIGLSIRNIKNARPGVHLSTIDEHKRTVGLIHSLAPDTTLVAGGSGFSLYGEELMNAIPEIDLGVFGEGEETFPDLLANLDTPQGVPGVFHREGQEVHFTGRRPPVAVGSLTRPNRDLFDVQAYAREPIGIAVQAKRGCALDCIHCSNHHLFQRKLRIREAEDVVNEIQELNDSYGVRRFMFADEIFNLPRRHADEIAMEIVRRNLRVEWSGWFKESELTVDSVKLWRRAGCQCLYFSPDVASNELLKLWGKGLTEEDLYSALEIVKRSGIRAEWNFMVNGPGETWSSLRKLAGFITRAKFSLGSRMRLNGCFVLVVRIYPHTRLQEYAISEGIIESNNDLLEPTYYNPPPLSLPLKPILSALGSAWRLRQIMRLIKNPSSFHD